ncbi:SunS family peptide S-glycosyltransferase [Bacillus sp. CDB3]|uniref:SunS family peptide S-glycosyltransferase n=1 Tax=Bacillus sp. CDB3 TaxID=360310 RepID=UPI0009D7FCB4|nr:SunS family peptide S-glycosyltransferase [Bacillus sp. CDB3]OQR53364.1 SunS family peptide S-glycosyltransferase [Bacillus sp. CDB3]
MNLKDLLSKLQKFDRKSSLSEDLQLIKNMESYGNFNIHISDNNILEDLIFQYDNIDCPSITCGILTYNEEYSIKRCLESVRGEFTEVIVLDSYSTDNTVKVIKENFSTVKIFFESWIDDFSHHRNKLIELATSEWIYFIDADNWYDSDNRGKIKRIAKLIKFLDIRCVISPMIGEHDGHIYTDNRKMFSLTENLLFTGKVHEEPIAYNGNVPENITVDIMVHHDGYDPQFVDQVKKNARNIRLTEKMLELEPSNPKWSYFYARELYQAKKGIEKVYSILLTTMKLYETSNYKRYQSETILLLCKICCQTDRFQKLNEFVSLLEYVHPNCSDVNYYRAILLSFDIRVRAKKIKDSLQLSFVNENMYSFINSSNDHIKSLLIQLHWYLEDWDSALKLYEGIESGETKQEISNYFNVLQSNALKMT